MTITPAKPRRRHRATASYQAPLPDSQMALPGMETPAAEEKKRAWPDLSAYGLHFGIVKLQNGEERLVMVDPEGAWDQHAAQWGFTRSRWVGLWVKSSLKFSLPNFNILFPNAEILQLTDTEIRDSVKTLIISRQAMRVSQAAEGAGRFSWHPNRKVVLRASSASAPDDYPDLSPDVALRQTLYLGLNHLSQEVYEAGDGQRFAKAGGIIAAREDGEPTPIFLRQSKDDPEGSLVLCATGLVREIQQGRNLRSEDFERYLIAVRGDTAAKEAAAIAAFHVALDAALMVVAADAPGDTAQAAFDTALRLHESRPSYFRESGTIPTPLPLAALMQDIAASRTLSGSDRWLDIGTGAPGSHSWRWPSVTAVAPDELIEHDIAVCGVFSGEIPEELVSGLRVSRADHKVILESLALRNPAGVSVFLIAGGSKPGKLDTDFKRVLSCVGAQYDLVGVVDLDASLIATGNQTPSRLLVVGPKRAEVDHTFAVPMSVPVHYDYGSLWTWAEAVCATGPGQSLSFGDEDTREDNRWQAPYIPASQVSEPEAMSPRNMLGPVRKALANIVEATGMSIDDYVATKLQWSLDEMEGYLSAEQVDATALAIFAIDASRGFVEADQTGLGKGRVLAASMRYARLQGMPVLFLTEKSDLFRDIYRDISDIGSRALFNDPFVLNSSLIVRDENGLEIGRSPSKEALIKVLSSGRPPEAGLSLGTYSQFNRKPSKTSSLPQHAAALACLEMTTGGATRHAVLTQWDGFLQRKIGGGLLLDDVRLLPAGDDNAMAVSLLKNILSGLNPAQLSAAPYQQLQEQLLLRSMTDTEFLQALRTHVISDAQVLKQEWIRSNAFEHGLVVMDEAHVAAGPTSQTNANLDFVVAGSKSILQSSATFAKKNGNFTLFRRIFPASVNTATVEGTLDRGGAPLQELLSAMLAEDGRMIRREHDLSMVDFKMTVDTGRVERNEMWANKLADVLSAMALMSGEIEEAVNAVNDKAEAALKKAYQASKASGSTASKARRSSGVQYTNFSSRFYTLSRAFMLTLAADISADMAIKALAEGRKPVITVDNTMESVLRDVIDPKAFLEDSPGALLDADGNVVEASPADALAGFGSMPGDNTLEDADLGIGFDVPVPPQGQASPEPSTAEVLPKSRGSYPLGRRIGFKDVLRTYADNIFLGWEWKDVAQPDGTRVRVRTRANLQQPGMEAGLAAIHDLIDTFPYISVSPLDDLKRTIEAAGYSIGELSGRQLSLQEDLEGNHVVVRMPARSHNMIRDAFNHGKLDAVLLSRSGSTGNSMHSSARFGDQSQRELIEMQAAADIVQRLQFWGRVNRKGQVCPPVVRMISSGLPGELRLMSMQNANLRKLSANISGNADNSAIDEKVPDILNRIGNEVCYRWLESSPVVAASMGIKLGDMTEGGSLNLEDGPSLSGTRFVDLLTGRISMLNVALQRKVYADISSEFRALVEQYELEGRNPLKSSAHDLRATKGEGLVIEIPPCAENSVFNEPVRATELHYVERLEGIPEETLRADCARSRASLEFNHGANWQGDLFTAMDAHMTSMMPAMLSKRHSTIEEAMADPDQNAIKNLAGRVDFIKGSLNYLIPGSSFTLQYTEDGPIETYLVVDLVPPCAAAGAVNPSSYGLKVRSRHNRSLRTLTLSSLMRAGIAFQPDIRYGWKEYDTYSKSLFEDLSQTHDYPSTRVILEGNLFRAAQISDTRKVGQAVTYTDEKGVWHHAILMPANMPLERVNQLPLDLVDPVMLQALLEENEYATVTDAFRMEDSTWSVTADDGNYRLVFRQANDGTPWLLNSTHIAATLQQGWQGSRALRFATVNPEQLAEFCVAVMQAATAAKVSVSAAGIHRKWALAYGERSRVKTSAEMAIEALAKSEEAGLDDIDAQLASMRL